jgi:DNA polymerase-3 subunit delta
MELKAAELGRQLARELAPIYLVSGDEPLLVQEACDAIVAAARAAGFSERAVLHAEGSFDWTEVLQESASLSLFAERRLIDVRLPAAAFGREGSDVLVEYARKPAPDTLLLVRCARIDARQRSSAWYKALAQVGVIVAVWPVSAAELPRWLEGRLQAAGLRCTREALQALAQRVEGNLLAAVQEIEKLALHELPQPIGLEDLLSVLEDAAHYDTFELIDAALAGDGARVARMVASLRQEGVAVFALLGALVAQLRRLAAGERMPPQRQRVVAEFERRVGGRRGVDAVLATCALIDAQGKGEVPGDPWRSLEELLLGFGGVRILGGTGGLALLRTIR